MTNNFFDTKYPIACAPMNQVGTREFLNSCYDSGILPSVFQNPDSQKSLITSYLEQELRPLLVAVSAYRLVTDEYYRKFTMELPFSHLEFISDISNEEKEMTTKFYDILFKLKETKKIIYKRFYANMPKPLYNIVDAFTVKGSEGAGHPGNDLLDSEVDKYKSLYSKFTFLAEGGINNKNQLLKYSNLGIKGFLIGSLLAASKESNLSSESKQILINKTSKDLQKLSTGQQGIIFSHVDDTDKNYTKSLKLGILTGNRGHLFIGSNIDYITKELSIKEIIDNIVPKEWKYE